MYRWIMHNKAKNARIYAFVCWLAQSRSHWCLCIFLYEFYTKSTAHNIQLKASSQQHSSVFVCVYMLLCEHNGGKHGCYGSYRIIVRINQDHGGSEAVLALTHLACFFNKNTTELTEACWNVLAWRPCCNSDATWRYNKPLLPHRFPVVLKIVCCSKSSYLNYLTNAWLKTQTHTHSLPHGRQSGFKINTITKH